MSLPSSGHVHSPSSGLIAYGPVLIDEYRRTASYVDRVLKGKKPSELPVQTPVKFELVIDMKTARAFGLTVSDKLRALAETLSTRRRFFFLPASNLP